MIGKAKAELKNSTFRKECAGLKTAHFEGAQSNSGKELLWLTQHQKKCAGLKIGGMLWMELRLQQSEAVQVIRQNW